MKKLLCSFVALCSLTSCKGLYDSTIIPVVELTTMNPQSAANWKTTPLTITGRGFPKGDTGREVEVMVSGTKATDVHVDAEGRTITCTVPERPAYEGPAVIDVNIYGVSHSLEQFSYFGPFEPAKLSVGAPVERLAVAAAGRASASAGNPVTDLAVTSGGKLAVYQVTQTGKSVPAFSAPMPVISDVQAIFGVGFAMAQAGLRIAAIVQAKDATSDVLLKAWMVPRGGQTVGNPGYWGFGPEKRPYALATGRFSNRDYDDIVVYSGVSLTQFGYDLPISGAWNSRNDQTLPVVGGTTINVGFLAPGDVDGNGFDDLLLAERFDGPQTAQGRIGLALGSERVFPQNPMLFSPVNQLFPSGLAFADFLPSNGTRTLEPCVLVAAAPVGQLHLLNPLVLPTQGASTLTSSEFMYSEIPTPPSGTSYLTATGAFDVASVADPATSPAAAADLAVAVPTPGVGSPGGDFVRVYLNFRSGTTQRYVDTRLPGKPVAMATGDA